MIIYSNIDNNISLWNYEISRSPAIMSQMTICIAALADNKKSVFFCADQMISLPIGQQVNRTDINKITKLTENCSVLSAGILGFTDDVLNGAKNIISDALTPKKSSFSVAEIASIVGQAYIEKRRSHIERTILQPKGISYSNLSALKELPEFMTNEINATINFNSYIDASFIIVGKDHDECHMYKLVFPGSLSSVDSEGYAAIGNASPIAENMIVKSGFQRNKSLEEVKKIILLAKKSCEVMPGIGETTTEGSF